MVGFLTKLLTPLGMVVILIILIWISLVWRRKQKDFKIGRKSEKLKKRDIN